MTTHELKAWPRAFAAILDGSKNYEIRRFDRLFAVGDTLLLREWEPRSECRDDAGVYGHYTGRQISVVVTYLTLGGEWGLPLDLCVMAITQSGSATIPTDLLARFQAAKRDAKDWSSAHAVVATADLQALLVLVEASRPLTARGWTRVGHADAGYCDTRKPVSLTNPCPECGKVLDWARVLDDGEKEVGGSERT